MDLKFFMNMNTSLLVDFLDFLTLILIICMKYKNACFVYFIRCFVQIIYSFDANLLLSLTKIFFHVTNFIFNLSKLNLPFIYLLFLLSNVVKVTT